MPKFLLSYFFGPNEIEKFIFPPQRLGRLFDQFDAFSAFGAIFFPLTENETLTKKVREKVHRNFSTIFDHFAPDMLTFKNPWRSWGVMTGL